MNRGNKMFILICVWIVLKYKCTCHPRGHKSMLMNFKLDDNGISVTDIPLQYYVPLYTRHCRQSDLHCNIWIHCLGKCWTLEKYFILKYQNKHVTLIFHLYKYIMKICGAEKIWLILLSYAGSNAPPPPPPTYISVTTAFFVVCGEGVQCQSVWFLHHFCLQ